MTVQTISNTYNNNAEVNLPSNSRNIRVTLNAGRGGNGGTDGNPTEAAGAGGVGRVGTFTLDRNFVARTLRLRPGGRGQNGTNGFDSTEGIGGAGGNAGASAGGRGQNQRATDISGGAGGGGGSSGVFDTFSDAWVAVAGGGGGGGGASDERDGGDGSDGSGWVGGNVNPTNGDGFGNEFTSGDGGGGGGGGGGAPGGDRGTQGADGNSSSTGGEGGTSRYDSSLASLSGGNATNSGPGFITLTYEVVTPVINTFFANPDPQTSGSDGVPNYNTTLNWTTTDAQTVTITNPGIDVGTVSVDGTEPITNLPQSVAGSNSPATRSYTLTACTGGVCVSSTITVQVFNDNTPNDYSIPNQSNLLPNTSYNINLGTITGIDMVTNVIGGPGVTVTKNNLQNYVSSINIVNGDSVQLRFFSDSFNTDPTGQPTAPRSLYIDIGPVRRFFTISTRAPDVNETFNMKDENTRVPFPDIDTISEPSLQYIVSETVSVNDIELQSPNGVEIKTSNANTQVRINGGTWRDVRSI